MLAFVRPLSLVLLTLLSAACSSQPPVEPDPAARATQARAAFFAAVEAREAGDAQTTRDALREAVALQPTHPTMLYHAAAAEAASGRHARAELLLGKLARMGVGVELGQVEAFAPLAGREGFVRIAAQLRQNGVSFGRTPLRLRWSAEAVPMPFLPEGIAHDSETGAWFLASVARGLILRTVDGRGVEILSQDQTGRGYFGLAHDAARSGLWAVASPPPGAAGGRSALIWIPLRAAPPGAVLPGQTRSWFDEPRSVEVPGDQPAALGDLLLCRDGTLLLADGAGGTVWRFRPPEPEDSAAPARLERWLQGPPLPSPQGLAAAAGGIYLADYSTGLHRIHPRRGERLPLRLPPDLCALGIDGLVAADQHHLIAVQNGFAPQRILWLTLSADGRAVEAWQVLAAALPEWREPTLGLVAEGRFIFVANSHWPDFADFDQPTGPQTRPEFRELALPD